MDNQFEREKASFEHNSAQLRALNEQMGKVPTMSITLTGGLWFAASQVPTLETSLKFGLLVFAGVANLGLALSCLRIRDVLQSYLERIREFAPLYFADGTPKKPVLERFQGYSMIAIYCGLMLSAAALSFAGAFMFYWPFHVSSRWLGVALLLIALLSTGVGAIKRKSDRHEL